MGSLSVLLKESWSFVERPDRLAENFYARMFLADPALRDLFPITMDVQRSRLLQAIVHAVQTVDDPEAFGAYLGALGRDHRKFHVLPEQYITVGRCLIAALREACSTQWTIAHEQAWQDAYAAISVKMITAAAADRDNPPYWHAEVVKHERRTPDIAVLTVRPLQPYPYRAGQYVSVECQYHPRLWRVFSIANAPRADGLMQFHVRAVGAGFVSSALVWKAKPGDMLRLGAPIGTMSLDRTSTRDVVCVAGGTGLAPLKSLIEELATFNRTRWVHLFFGVRSRADLYDLGALNQLAGRHSWLSVVPSLSEDPGAPGCEQGTAAEVVARRGPWQEHDFFVSGSPAMVRSTLSTLSVLGIPRQRIRYDTLTSTVTGA
ncbi:globin domain-containing protein [Longispora albida]|uniref:globin domain-containing protein n=1 Tax=Longispora albida TaxID=203523 RepID=UPI0003AAB814|nr:globin domain-containing protein [Longispora albida]